MRKECFPMKKEYNPADRDNVSKEAHEAYKKGEKYDVGDSGGRKVWKMMNEDQIKMSRERNFELIDKKLEEAIIKNPKLVMDSMEESNWNKNLDKFYAELIKISGINDFYLSSSYISSEKRKSSEIRFWDFLPEVESDGTHFSDNGTGRKIADCLGDIKEVLAIFNEEEYDITIAHQKQLEDGSKGVIYHIKKKEK